MRDLPLDVDFALLDHANQRHVVDRATAERSDHLEFLEHDLTGHDRNGLVRITHHAQPPPDANTLERLFNRARVSDNLHGDVGPTAGQLLDLFADALDLARIDRFGRPELRRPFELAGVDIDGNHITAGG